VRERDGIAKLSRRTKSGGTFLHRRLLLALTRKPPPVFVLDLHLDRAVFFGPERTRRFAGRNTPLTAQLRFELIRVSCTHALLPGNEHSNRSALESVELVAAWVRLSRWGRRRPTCSRSGRLLRECIRGERTAIRQAGAQRVRTSSTKSAPVGFRTKFISQMAGAQVARRRARAVAR
jgi:hypothetical protein